MRYELSNCITILFWIWKHLKLEMKFVCNNSGICLCCYNNIWFSLIFDTYMYVFFMATFLKLYLVLLNKQTRERKNMLSFGVFLVSFWSLHVNDSNCRFWRVLFISNLFIDIITLYLLFQLDIFSIVYRNSSQYKVLVQHFRLLNMYKQKQELVEYDR